MKGLKIIFIVLILAVCSGIIFYISSMKKGKVCFNNNCFDVELALSQSQIEKGLMFRNSLGEKQGMLFVFPEQGDYGFWMKNTKIPLDIIWINENSEVAFISENAQICENGNDLCPVIKPGKNAKYVLEINAFEAEKIGLKQGDKASVSF